MTHVSQRPARAGSDEGLVRRFVEGDETAFDEIVRAHRGEIYRVARRILGSHEDADEAAQEALVRAWRSLDGFRGDSSIRTWLVRIAVNVARTMLRRRGPETTVDELPAVADGGSGADQRIDRARVRAGVRQAVAALPERQREVVVLKVFSAMTYREVAEVMGISEGAAKAHLHQAVANLRKIMASATPGHGES